MEGLKRAQCSRLEDQRGTEINFELPDFLKNKENYSQNKNPHKILAKGSADSTYAGYNFEPSITTPTTTATTALITTTTTASMTNIPKPMPRFSITAKSNINNNNNNDLHNISSIKVFPSVNQNDSSVQSSNCLIGRHYDSSINHSSSTPPPLPPKPKILPIKPMNWGQQTVCTSSPPKDRTDVHSSIEILNESKEDCNAYLDQPSSSIV